MNDKLKLESFLGETNLYDKKEKLEKNKPKSWLKSVSAFANSKVSNYYLVSSKTTQLLDWKNSKKIQSI